MAGSIFIDSISIYTELTSSVLHNWYFLPPSSAASPRTLFSHKPSSLNLLPLYCPPNDIFNNNSCLRMWPIHLFCRVLTVFIISLSVSTISTNSSFICFMLSQRSFIVRLHIHILNASSRRMSFLCSPCFTSIQRKAPNKCFHRTFLQSIRLTDLCMGSLCWLKVLHNAILFLTS